MSNENQETPKKIIIDEDWKSQVAAERAATDENSVPAENTPQDPEEMPPASFEMLLTSLATDAMMSMGQMPIPGIEKPEVNMPQAQYVIDILRVLKEKTEGNLSTEEGALLENLLHQLRMMYVAVGQ